MSEETVVIICPNSKCRREIEEPILLAILSVKPQKEYEACPYCFTELKPEPSVEKEEVLNEIEEPVTSTKSETLVPERVKAGPRFLKKFRSLIPGSGGNQKEVDEPQAEPVVIEEEKVTIDEPTPEPLVEEETKEPPKLEPLVREEPKEAPKTEQPETKEDTSSGCPHEFGYLANRPPDTSIPSQCLVCTKMVDCMLSPRD